jgi:hypothetical protein
VKNPSLRFMSICSATAICVTIGGSRSIASRNCYVTNDVTVCHDTNDEASIFPTPGDRVAYYPQVVREADGRYHWIYHSEPRGKTPAASIGDSLRGGLSWGYYFPISAGYKIWGSQTDPASLLYSPFDSSPSGGANPMVIRGRHDLGDPYNYVYFLTEQPDPTAGSLLYLSVARTTNYETFDLRSEAGGWTAFNDTTCPRSNPPAAACRPQRLLDQNNAVISAPIKGGPLIGSIVEVNGISYYFYSECRDTSPTGDCTTGYRFVYRVNSGHNPADGLPTWSAKLTVKDTQAGGYVAKATINGTDRWLVAYWCGDQLPYGGDYCIQYSTDMSIASLAALNYSDSTKGLRLGAAATHNVMQATLLKDDQGRVVSPSGNPAKGGEIFFMQWPGGSPWGAPLYRAGWDICSSGCGTSPPAPQMHSMIAGQSLFPNDTLVSSDQRFTLIYQTDGNLVLYQSGVGAIWNTGTWPVTGQAALQADGNFVVYRSDGVPLWYSGTAGVSPVQLNLQNDGNLVLYGPNGAVWSSGTCCR